MRARSILWKVYVDCSCFPRLTTATLCVAACSFILCMHLAMGMGMLSSAFAGAQQAQTTKLLSFWQPWRAVKEPPVPNVANGSGAECTCPELATLARTV